MKPFSLGAALCLLLSVPAFAQTENYGFKGIELGSHVSLVANNPKFDCRAVKTPTADRVCGFRKDETETIAGVTVTSLFYFYDQSLLTGINLQFPEKQFDKVVAALTSKYGDSTQTVETVKTYAGNTFDNRIHSWRRDGQSIVAKRYSNRVDTSSVRIADDMAEARIKERRARIKANPASDL